MTERANHTASDASERLSTHMVSSLDRVAQLWFLVEEFYTSRIIFNEIYERYERMVLKYARERGVDRKVLRLNAVEVSGLLNFKELEDLRNNHLFPLKNLSHALFRGADSTDKFDRYLSDVYHEISILKEEQYKVRAYAPEYERAQEQEELDTILAEVHEFFPQKVHHIHNLFRKAQGRLEEILPAHSRERVLIRSLYLYGGDLLAAVYAGGLDDLYAVIYPVGGAAEAYMEVARSFLESGFADEGREALRKVIDAVDRTEHPTPKVADLRAEAELRLRKIETGRAESTKFPDTSGAGIPAGQSTADGRAGREAHG